MIDCSQAYSDALRAELVDRVQVLSILPGFIKTNIAKNATIGSGEKAAQPHPDVDNGYSCGNFILNLSQFFNLLSEYLASESFKQMLRGEHEVFIAQPYLHFASFVRFFLPDIFFRSVRNQWKAKIE